MDASFLKTGTIQTQLDRLMLQLRWQAARLGTIGKIGLGLIVFAGICFFLGGFAEGLRSAKAKRTS